MPTTITTTERFEPTVTKRRIEKEIQLRMKAGAFRSWIDEAAPKWTLKTEWNILGATQGTSSRESRNRRGG